MTSAQTLQFGHLLLSNSSFSSSKSPKNKRFTLLIVVLTELQRHTEAVWLIRLTASTPLRSLVEKNTRGPIKPGIGFKIVSAFQRLCDGNGRENTDGTHNLQLVGVKSQATHPGFPSTDLTAGKTFLNKQFSYSKHSRLGSYSYMLHITH